MVFLDKLSDVRSDRCSVKAHHEQLALRGTLLADPLAALSRKRPTIALHHSNVSRAFGHIAQTADGNASMLTYRDHPTRDQLSPSSP
jgi:hypothetical protein